MKIIPGMSPTRRVEWTGAGYTVFVKPPAFFNQREVVVPLTIDQYQRFMLWLEGAGKIQDLLGDLDANDRERLLSGLDEADDIWRGDD